MPTARWCIRDSSTPQTLTATPCGPITRHRSGIGLPVAASEVEKSAVVGNWSFTSAVDQAEEALSAATAQHLTQPLRRRNDSGCMEPARLPRQSFDRARHAHRGDDLPGRGAYGCRNRGDALLPLTNRMGPAAPAYRRQGNRGEPAAS